MDGCKNAGLKIFQWNCNGLLTHINEFKHHLSENSYDVICLQETFLKHAKTFIGDLNSKSTLWGSPYTDLRSLQLLVKAKGASTKY